MQDEGRPFGVALQEEASNHFTLLQLRAVVVSGKEKAELDSVRYDQRRRREEPSMIRRKRRNECQNQEVVVGLG